MSGLAAVLMATTHVLFQLPASVLGLVFYSRELHSPLLFSIYVIALSASAIGSLADFLIYTFIYRAFRRRVANLFNASVACCSCGRRTRSAEFRQRAHSGRECLRGAALTGKASPAAQRGQSNSSEDFDSRSHRIELESIHRVSNSSRDIRQENGNFLVVSNQQDKSF